MIEASSFVIVVERFEASTIHMNELLAVFGPEVLVSEGLNLDLHPLVVRLQYCLGKDVVGLS